MPNETYLDEESKPPIITEEILQEIADRANAYGKALKGGYDSAPDKIIIEDNGTIKLRWESYCCGSTDYDDIYCSAADLMKDNATIVKEREERERKEEEERRKRVALEQKQKEEKEKERRKQQFLELQKEFGTQPFTT